ncbi:MAG TPA: DNA primase [Clostridiales bacterium]|nr:DNA primase [Clostridiales bacterium]
MDIVSQFVPLKRKGRDYWACCPFHHEKTPSFQVRADYQYFKCFGCQKSGNVITFIMEHERLSYPEAVEWLAKKANLQIPESFESPDFKERKKTIKKIYAANLEAARFYNGVLFSSQGKKALDYLKKRGLSESTIKTFGLGYSPNAQELPKYMIKKGYAIETLEKAGLVRLDKLSSPYDFYAGRIIFPIINAFGDVTGFGGRALMETNFAKYLNTYASPAFDKKGTLYNINLFKKLKQSQPVKSLVLVEGYMDVISLHQGGIRNTMAPMGTSLTIEQCRIIKRYTDLVYVCFDGDSAGQSAALRSLDLLKEQGLDVKVVELPKDADPDDTIKKIGKKGFEKLLEEALPLLDFKLKKIEEKYDLSTLDGKNKYATEAIAELFKLNDIEKEVYAVKVSNKSGLSTDTILIGAKQPKPFAITAYEPPKNRLTSANLDAARFIFSAILNYKSFVDISGIKELSKDHFELEEHKKIYEYIMDSIQNGTSPQISDLFDLIEEKDEINSVIDALNNIYTENQQTYYIESLEQLKMDYRQKIINELKQKLSYETDENKKRELVIEYQKLIKNKNEEK